MSLEPVEGPAEVIEPVERLSAVKKEMELTRIAGEFGFDSVLFQRHEHLLALTDQATLIGLAVNDQRRCGCLVDMR